MKIKKDKTGKIVKHYEIVFYSCGLPKEYVRKQYRAVLVPNEVLTSEGLLYNILYDEIIANMIEIRKEASNDGVCPDFDIEITFEHISLYEYKVATGLIPRRPKKEEYEY